MRRKATFKTAGFIRSFFLIVLLFFIACALFFSYQLWGIKHWDGASRFTFVVYQTTPLSVVDDSPIILFTIEPASSRAFYLRIPSDAILNVPYGYEMYKSLAVYRLGELDKTRGGGRLLSRSVSNSFKVFVDGYAVLKSGDLYPFPQNAEQVKSLKSKYFSFFSIFSLIQSYFIPKEKLDSSLSLGDRFRIWNAIRTLRSDQIVVKDLSMSDIVSDTKLADGSIVRSIDQELLDLLITDNFQDTKIRSSVASIEVVNATEFTGLASTLSTMLSHLGAHVISKVNAQQNQKSACVIRGSDADSLKIALVKKMIAMYSCTIDTHYMVNAQSDIQITLGSDFLNL